MPTRLARALLYLLGAGFLYASFFIATTWGDFYLMHYGRFLLSRGELAFKLHLLLFVLPATVLVALALAELVPRRLFRARDQAIGRRPVVMFSVAVALLVLGLAMLIRVTVLRETAMTDDENVYHFQAQLLASGRLYAESAPEPVRAFFNNQFIINNGRRFGSYFVGHSALLALASWLGIMEWVGPIAAALTALLAIGIARRVFEDAVATVTGMLLVVSPFFIFVSATHLSQPTSTVFLTLFTYSAIRIETSPDARRWWIVAALALVASVFIRPQTGVFLSLPFGLRVLYLLARGRLRPSWLSPLLSLCILGCGAVGFLAVNHALTGSIFRTGYQAYMAQGIPWLFPFGPTHTVREISQNLSQLNFWLLGWPVSLAFVPLFRRSAQAWTLAAIPVVSLVWYGVMAVPTVAAVGPVYYAETIVPLVILTASGIERAVAFARHHLGDAWPTRALIVAPVAGILACLLAFVPFEVISLRLMADIARAPYDLAEEQRLDHAVVFVRDLPALQQAPGAWVYYHRNASPDLSDPVLFVRDLGPERNLLLMTYLPDRTPYWMGMQNGRLGLHPIESGRPPASR
jgi:Dolichyl-phosphate-mannose-protein mannosyltransferase